MYRIYTGQFHDLIERSGSPSASDAANLALESVELACRFNPSLEIYLGKLDRTGKITLEPISLQELRRLAEGK